MREPIDRPIEKRDSLHAREGALRAAAFFALLATAALALGCGAAMPRYPLRPIVWDDPDRRPFAPAPEERWVPYYWDATDNLFVRPVVELLAFEPRREAVNVNALDEVPSSSWFTNRIGRTAMSPEEVAVGPCEGLELDAPGPWTITGGKPSGASPGFFIEDANGVRYLLKTDRAGQPEQSTAADAIVASILHAAGYNVPCNRVVFFDPSILVIGEGVTTRDGRHRRPITQADIDRVASAAMPAPGGLRRVVLSRFIDARPIGPWSYTGTLPEDPNDVVPHERRRELRGLYVLDSWVNHWDSRQENTLAGWVEADGGGYVRHYLIDFGEALGLRRGPHREHARSGHTAYLDLGHLLEDTLTLGLYPRPWHGRTNHPIFGYFDAASFDPDRWRPQYWNGAFERRTERDVAWAARIVARFDDERLRALVRLGRFTDPAVEARLFDILRGRRDRLLARYLGVLSPLADPRIARAEDGRARLCLTDLAVRAGVREGMDPGAAAHRDGSPIEVALEAQGDEVCATFPALRGAGGGGDYVVLEVTSAPSRRPLRLHLYVVGEDELQLVGLQRL